MVVDNLDCNICPSYIRQNLISGTFCGQAFPFKQENEKWFIHCFNNRDHHEGKEP